MTANNPHEIAMRADAENRRLQAINADLLAALEAYDHAIDLCATAKGARKTVIPGLGITRQKLATETLREARKKASTAIAKAKE